MIKGETRVVGRMVEYRPVKRLKFVPGQMIVRVNEASVAPSLGAAGLKFTAAAAKALPENVTGPIEYLRRNAGLKSVTPIFSSRRGQVMGAKVAGPARFGLAVASSVADSESEELAGINLVEVDPR